MGCLSALVEALDSGGTWLCLRVAMLPAVSLSYVMPVLLLCVAYSCNIILALIQTQGVSVEHESSLHIFTTFICHLSAQNWSEILISAEQALQQIRACSASHISADGRLFKRHMTQSHTKSQILYFVHFSAHSIARHGILYIVGISISRTI